MMKAPLRLDPSALHYLVTYLLTYLLTYSHLREDARASGPLSLAPFRADGSRDARMSRSEVLSPEGLRLDGRRPGEIRRLRCQLSAEPKADGSAYLEQGNTKVLVTVTGPHEVSSQRKAQHDRAVLHCTYAALPFSAGQHKNPSRTADSELATSVRSVFDPVVQTQLYPRTQIDVSITLLQAD